MTGVFDWQAFLEPATVRILAPLLNGDHKFLGSGFFLSPRILATAAHVVQDESRGGEYYPLLVAELKSGKQVNFVVSGTHSDAAILKLDPSDQPNSCEDDLTSDSVSHKNFVMCCDIVVTGDLFATFGFPIGDYLGQPATFTAVGKSNIDNDKRFRYRAVGLAPGHGASGSPVINLRTGGVYGLLSHSNQDTRVHIEPIAPLINLIPGSERLLQTDWLNNLTDEQLRAGKWSWATRDLKEYVKASLVYYDTHPYAGMLFDDNAPPLSSVHVRQSFLEWDVVEESVPKSAPSDQELALRGGSFLEDVMHGGLLVGAPGGGKSSALRMLSRQPCERFMPGTAADIPILIDAAEIELDRPLATTIADVINSRFFHGETRYTADFFSAPPMPLGHWQLLVDGLDEILDARRRTSVVEKAIEFMSSSPEAKSRIVFSTRPLPMDEMENIRRQTSGGVWEIRSFEPDEIVEVMGHWFKAMGHENPGASAKSVLAQLGGHSEMALLRNPLMLTMVCQLYGWNPNRQIPKTRTAIYGNFTSALRERFYDRGPGNALTQASAMVSRYGPTAVKHVDVVVERVYQTIGSVALEWLSTDSLPDMSGVLDISTAPLNMRVDEWVRLSHEITRRSGVVVQEGESLKFLHQTLAEYLASWTLTVVHEINLRTLDGLFGQTSRIGQKRSFIRFAAETWLRDDRFADWLVTEMRTNVASGTELVSQIIEDGLQLPKVVRTAFVDSLATSARSMADPAAANVVSTIRRLTLAAEPAVIDDALIQIIIETKRDQEIRLWAISYLADRISGSITGTVADNLPSATAVDRAIDVLSSSKRPDIRELVSVIASDSSLGLFVQQRAMHSLGQRVPKDSATADFLPRIISLARPTGALALLTKTARANYAKADVALIERAYAMAERSHSRLDNASGESHIADAIAVAAILAELGFAATTLAAVLLRDTVEDTSYTLAELTRDFGSEVAMLVDGVTKLDKVQFGEAASSETVQKMVVAMAKDLRVLMIKLADRLHRARTWRFVSAESSAREARETLEIFVPLTDRLGLDTIRWELEDLSFAALYPKAYEEVVRMMGDRFPNRETSLSVILNRITEDLRVARITATITGRTKHYYSIFQEMIERGKDLDGVNDVLGVQVLVDSVRDCYAALGATHARWNPLPGHYKDYIAVPTSDMYQALHTTVIGPGGEPVEIQIRTHEMYQRAEYGVAARRKYKDWPFRIVERPGSPKDGDGGWLRSLVNWKQETSDPGGFLDSLRLEIDAKEVFVFTPKGEVLALPAGSTPVDFAYAVHTEVGHRTIGARVNGNRVPLDCRLNHGDWVEIFTSKAEGAGPSLDWQHFVKTRRARNKIRQWFSKERARRQSTAAGSG